MSARTLDITLLTTSMETLRLLRCCYVERKRTSEPICVHWRESGEIWRPSLAAEVQTISEVLTFAAGLHVHAPISHGSSAHKLSPSYLNTLCPPFALRLH